MKFKLVGEADAKRVLEFCLELKEQDARMSFTSVDTEEKLLAWINDPLIYLFVSKNETGEITSMFRAITRRARNG